MNIVLVKYFMLYIVPTPIGNLQDITLRALDILKQADFVLCEDTRQTKKLLDNFGIATKTLRYHEGDKFSVENCLNLLKSGKVCALVSDAGTPCVSDPGWQLVRRAREEGIKVCALPGPSALTCALSASGVGGGGFVFLGFTSRKPGKIVKLLKSAFELEKPVVIYESPYRIIKFLKLVKENFAENITCVLAREITKTFEEYLSGTLEDVIKNLEARKKILGEFVVILDARSTQAAEEDNEEFNDR